MNFIRKGHAVIGAAVGAWVWCGVTRCSSLTVVLTEDFGVRYDPERKNGSLTATEGDGFFADSSKVFLHGLLGSKRQGTCSSMPVLYVSVGRRLGYPLKLVTTKGHLFVRWEGAGERSNVEAGERRTGPRRVS